MTSMPIETGRLFIAGEWREAESRETLPLENPSDGSVLTRIARGGAKDVDRAVAAAREALEGPWGRLTAAERGRILTAMGRIAQEKADELARLEALDVGKPLQPGTRRRAGDGRATSNSTPAPPTRCTARPSLISDGYTVLHACASRTA